MGFFAETFTRNTSYLVTFYIRQTNRFLFSVNKILCFTRRIKLLYTLRQPITNRRLIIFTAMRNIHRTSRRIKRIRSNYL